MRINRHISRRQFLKGTVIAGAGLALPAIPFKWMVRSAYPFAQSPILRKFVTTLPGLGPAGANNIGQYLPLPIGTRQTIAGLPTDVYNLGVKKFGEKMHPDLMRATHFYGYYDLGTGDQKYLGGVIVAQKGTPVLLNITNQVDPHHILPIDPTIMAGPNGQTVGDLPLNRIATHLHGGFTPWFSDGTPFQWFTPSGMTGPSFSNVPGLASPPPGTANYYYPMEQSARFVWYHDHAIGVTRINAYAGIASALLLIDTFETGLVSSGLLPDLVGIPLVIQDKTFVASTILSQDPTWQWGSVSDLWYAHVYEPNFFLPNPGPNPNPKGRWDYGATVHQGDASIPNSQGLTFPLPDPSIVPEFFADTAMVNGAPYPVVSVPPKRVRFRILNGSQARFHHLNLYKENPVGTGEVTTHFLTNGKPDLSFATAGPTMYQVGTEGGFLPAVAPHPNGIPCPLDPSDSTGNTANPDGPFNLLLAPAERADVIIDFNGVSQGSSFILYGDAPAPFPGGDPRNDYYTGDPDFTAPNKNSFGLSGGAPTTAQGSGPNTRTIMKIVVTSGSGDTVSTAAWLPLINAALKSNFGPNQPALLYNDGNPSEPGAVPYTGGVNRSLTLNEDFDEFGRLIQRLGTTTSISQDNQGLNTWGLPYIGNTTENPAANATEVWQLYNLTGDTHPIHFHLVNVQIIQRQAFMGDPLNGITLVGSPAPPDDNEIGWKETVRMNPGEVTTVIMKFTLPTLPTQAMTDANSPRTGGKEYVWHCHILEHEEHDMMRPLVVGT